ncbi:disintegrin-like metalloprotease [Melampsora americana]|nr:disintegrin-like metalloprotease [Melampsora americana]
MLQSILPLLLLSFSNQIKAHSIRSDPIQSVYQLNSASLQILPRLSSQSTSSTTLNKRNLHPPSPSHLRHNDSLLLRFSIPPSSRNPSSTQFSFSLHPTPDLIHPDAKINYHSFDSNTGQTTLNTLPLLPEDVLAYTGWVIEESSVETWWAEEHASIVRPPVWASSFDDPRVLGWARILVHDTTQMKSHDHLDQFVWEGSFTINGQLWHVKPLETFNQMRHSKDTIPIPLDSHVRGGLVAWPEDDDSTQSDNTLTISHANSISSQYPASCGHDNLAFNVDPEHQVYQTPSTSDAYISSQFQFAPYDPSPFSAPSMSTLLESLFGLPLLRPMANPRSQSSPTLAAHPSRVNNLLRRQILGGDISGLGNTSMSNFVNSIGSTTGCPIGARVAFIGVAADCTYVSRYGTQDAARTAILNNVNSASALYLKTFNVSIGVVELNVQSPVCPKTPDQNSPWNIGCPESGSQGLDLNQRLSAFSDWRGKKGGSDGAGLWHLMTNCSTGSEVGVAWLGQLCQVDATPGSTGQVTSGTGVTASSANEWTVMAHEIAHNFGAIHDCAGGCSLTSPCCPMSPSSCDTNSNYLMSPVATKKSTAFSPCSIGNVCTTLRDSLNTTCLVKPGQRSVISLQQCGNGIVEPGEDCDPGQGSSPCCDSKTCKFSSGSVCDPVNSPCCTGTCQFASSDVVCRPSIDPQCDQAEKCTGHDASCPTDGFVENGKSCGNSSAGLTCASGMCTSRDQQCQVHGTSLRLQTACPASATSTCQVACVDPTGRADCVILSNNFVDGTTCGYGGRCSQGKCQSGSVLDTAKSWFMSNLSIGIPIVIAAGILGLMFLWAIGRCLFNMVRSGRARRTLTPSNVPILPKPEEGLQPPPTHPNNAQPTLHPMYLPLQPGAPPVAPHNETRAGWVDPTAWNGRA